MKTFSKKRLEDYVIERVQGVLKEVETERKLQRIFIFNF
jgi:hypothetical protein